MGLCSSGAHKIASKYHHLWANTSDIAPSPGFAILALQSLHFVLNLLACVLVTCPGGKVTQGQAARAAGTAQIWEQFDWWHNLHPAIRALIVLEITTDGAKELSWECWAPGHWNTPKISLRATRTKAGLLLKLWCFAVCWHFYFFLGWKTDKSSFSEMPLVSGQSWESSPGCFAWGKQDGTGQNSTGEMPKEWLGMIKKWKISGLSAFFKLTSHQWNQCPSTAWSPLSGLI